ncbi:MAG: hypothetical protein ABSA14_07945, partial [Acidimicrobiales bacterium]
LALPGGGEFQVREREFRILTSAINDASGSSTLASLGVPRRLGAEAPHTVADGQHPAGPLRSTKPIGLASASTSFRGPPWSLLAPG